MAQRVTVKLGFPLQGVSDAWARAKQPPQTTPSALNVLPYDRDFRMRGAQRPGTSKLYQSAMGNGPVQCLLQATWIDSNGAPVESLIAVSAGGIYVDGSLITNSGASLSATAQVHGCVGAGNVAFFVDGTQVIKKLTLAGTSGAPTHSIADHAATEGSLPTADLTVKIATCCIWRDRLVLASPKHLWFMSRQGDYGDWDTAALDPAAAITGQTAIGVTTGAISDAIVSLMPWSEDVLLVGHDRRITKFLGDPRDGGSILDLTAGTGVVGPKAWCIAPDKRMWIVGSGGLYVFDGTNVQPISAENYPSYFLTINRSTHSIHLTWDRDRQGLWLFVTPTATASATHLFYDVRQGGFWPMQFPNSHGPTAVLVYDGDAPNDRRILLGGRTGYVQKILDTATTDDGTFITNYVYLGPIQPDETQTKLIEAVFGLGEIPGGFGAEDNWNFGYTLQCGEDAYTALSSPTQTQSSTFRTGGRQGPIGVRMTDRVFFVKVSNDSYIVTENGIKTVWSSGQSYSGSGTVSYTFWSLEEVVLTFVRAGRER